VSFGEFDENDIVRLEDVYGRVAAQGDVLKEPNPKRLDLPRNSGVTTGSTIKTDS
jgi:hypothetical protein